MGRPNGLLAPNEVKEFEGYSAVKYIWLYKHECKFKIG